MGFKWRDFEGNFKGTINEIFSKLFPLNNHKHEMAVRNPLRYQIKKANTVRLKVSTIPYMQRVLDDDYRKRKLENNSQHLQVNYVNNNNNNIFI